VSNRADEGRDAVVVGAGIVGISAAINLLAKGFRVRLMDPEPPGQGTSFGNAGVISPWSCIPQSMPGVLTKVPKWLLDPLGPVSLRWAYVPQLIPWLVRFIRAGQADRLPAIADAMLALNRWNADLYREMLDGTGHEGLVRDSLYLHIYRSPGGADLSRPEWSMRSERGVPVEAISGDELREIEPDLAPDYQSAAVIRQQARTVDPGAIGRVLTEDFQRRGGEVIEARTTRIRPQPDGVVRLDSSAGEQVADLVVVSAGAWTRDLVKPLGVKLPLEAERGYHLVFPEPGVVANNTIMEADAKFVANSMSMGMRMAGTGEFAGIDAPPDYRRATMFETLGKRMFPKLNTADAEPWMGRRPSFPDSLPVIGPLPGYPNIIVAAGHGHLGLTGAPMTGRLVGQMAAGETPNIDMAPYRADRF